MKTAQLSLKRAEAVRKDINKINDKYFDLIEDLDKHGSAIEKETLEDIRSSTYDIDRCMEYIIHAAKRIAELAKLGKYDRYMVARIKMAACEVCAAEKEIEMLKVMLKIK